MIRIPFIAGNWKMNMNSQEVSAFCKDFKDLYKGTDVKTALCVPFVHLQKVKEEVEGTNIKVGAQNVHFEDKGAYTGEVSVPMLEEIGVDYCIIGHSERREYFGETDESVNKKLHRLFQSTITPILCVGENLKDREEGKEEAVVKNQLVKDLKGLENHQVGKLVIAYEPIWAIGTGRTASPTQANEMCGFIREVLGDLYDEEVVDQVVIQYGGSMKPANATELMAMDEIDGGLVGGASLNPEDFMKIIDF